MSEELLKILKRVENNLEHHYPENIRDFNILKQTVMKSQEPKKYLKWEDLETETGCSRVDLNVSLNGTKYRLSYFPNNPLKLLTNDEDFYLEIENKQFFNSLHLERVEENE